MIILSLVSTLLLLSASFAKHHSNHHNNRNQTVAADAACTHVGHYRCFRADENGNKGCGVLWKMCNDTSECKDFDDGYCDQDECKKHGLPLELRDKSRTICIPKKMLCNQKNDVNFLVTSDESIAGYDEKHCMNGGRCIDNPKLDYNNPATLNNPANFMKICRCNPGFKGEKCEETEEPKTATPKEPPIELPTVPTTAPPKEPPIELPTVPTTAQTEPLSPEASAATGPILCTELEKNTMNCSMKGYVCPFVDCEPCDPPCQHKNITKYETGVYEGCVQNETCSGVLFTINMTDFEKRQCVGPCYEIKEAEGSGKRQGCRVQVCGEASCPIYPTPSISPCEDITTVYDDCGCPYKGLRNKTSDKCPVNCQTLIEDGEGCIIKCETTDSRTCDDNCETKVISGEVHNTMCTQLVTCLPKTCAEIGTAEGKCLFNETDEKRFTDDSNCKCDSNQQDQFVKHTCSHCEEKICKPTKCPKITMNCEDYQQSAQVVCGSEFNKTCPEYCQKSLQCICQAQSDCPKGLDQVLVDCQMTDAQCNKDKQCCEKLCPIEDNGKRKQYACKLRCEVCADMEGAMLTVDGLWKYGMEETCNADIRCCHGCIHSSMVERCPTEWSEEKKKLCFCKN